ncbi:MAG: hypothetical protein AB7O66_04920 [Limisphaerales bacterium]
MIQYWDDAMVSFVDRLRMFVRGGDSSKPERPNGDGLREWLRGCPIPTVEQTEAYADRIPMAHSWYKHLPLFPPGARFVFLLNPEAGRMEKRTSGRKVYEDDETTGELRNRFGIWNYLVDFDSMPKGEATEVPAELDASSDPPGCLPTACFAHFTAFLRPSYTLLAVCNRRLPWQLPAFEAWTRQNPGHSDAIRYEPFRKVAEQIVSDPNGGWRKLSGFAEEEGRFQRAHLTKSLLSAREAWIHFLRTD